MTRRRNNGAQSQGEVRRYFDEADDPTDFAIRVEISSEPDPSQRTEIAIARNTATRVQDISQAGKRGYFADPAKAFAQEYPDNKLALSETDIGEE